MKLIFIILVLLIHKISTNNTPFQYQHDLTPNDSDDYIWFGSSLSISGNRLAIGSSDSLGTAEMIKGRAYIFENENNNWNQKARLNINDGTNGDGFGTSISISNDIVVVGAPFANVSSNIEQGKVYIFKKNGNEWIQVAELIANDGEAEDQFGYSVFILGKTIAISSPNADGDLNEDQGCVYIFNGNEDGTIWNQTQKLFASDGQDYDQLGFSISISNDSNIMIIGAPYADVGNNEYQGKAYIFQNNGTYWNEIQILISSDGESWDEFGYSVFISSDSSWIIIGAPDANVGSNSEQGKAYIFQKNGNQWNETQILISSDGQEYDSFGWSSSISSDSSWLIIGSIYATDDSNEQQGKVYIFQKNGNQWDQVQSIIETNGFYYDQFGWSVLISDQFAIVGAPSSDSNDFEFIESGNVYVINNIPLSTSSSSSSSKTIIIVCSTIIPVVVIIVGVILTIFLIKKRRKQNQEISKDYRELKDN